MTFDEWWEENYADVKSETADRTFGEEVWNAAQADASSEALSDEIPSSS